MQESTLFVMWQTTALGAAILSATVVITFQMNLFDVILAYICFQIAASILFLLAIS